MLAGHVSLAALRFRIASMPPVCFRPAPAAATAAAAPLTLPLSRAAAAPRLRHAARPVFFGVRALASGRGGEPENKSWVELGKDAAGLLKTVAGKLLAPLGLGKAGPPAPPVAPAPEADVGRALGQALGGGLLGSLAGRVLGAGLQQLSRTMRDSAEAARETYERATAAIEADVNVRRRLGGAVRCGPVASQSASSMTINGAASSRVELSFAVMAADGRAAATARVAATTGGSSRAGGEPDRISIFVLFPDGSSIDVGSGGGGGGGTGRIIDVEAIEVAADDREGGPGRRR